MRYFRNPRKIGTWRRRRSMSRMVVRRQILRSLHNWRRIPPHRKRKLGANQRRIWAERRRLSADPRGMRASTMAPVRRRGWTREFHVPWLIRRGNWAQITHVSRTVRWSGALLWGIIIFLRWRIWGENPFLLIWNSEKNSLLNLNHCNLH